MPAHPLNPRRRACALAALTAYAAVKEDPFVACDLKDGNLMLILQDLISDALHLVQKVNEEGEHLVSEETFNAYMEAAFINYEAEADTNLDPLQIQTEPAAESA